MFFNNIYKHYIEPIRSFNQAARLFILMIIIDGVIYSGWQLFFNFYMLQSGFTRDYLGLVNSLPSAAGLIFGILAGRISDRIGRRASIMIGITLSSLSMLAQVSFHQPALIATFAFLNGVFSMLFIVSQAPLMVKLSNTENRTMLFSLTFGLQTLAGAVGSVFAGQLPAFFGGILDVDAHSAMAYRAVLIVSVLLGSSSLIPIWLMKEPQALPETPIQDDDPDKPSSNKLSPALIRLIVKLNAPQLIIGFGAAILIPYMNVFFKDRFNISDSLLGILFSVSSLMIGVGSIIAPRLSALLGGKIKAVVFTQFASLIFLLLAGFAPVLWMSSVGYLLRSALMNMAAPLYSAFCMEHTPEKHQGFVNSTLGLTWNIGWAVGPYISGIVQKSYGFTPLFITTAVLYLSAISLTWMFFNKTEQVNFSPLAAKAVG